VIHPPVAVETFFWKAPEDYYLIVSELVPYKRIDVAVRLFSKTGRKLCVVGDGPEYSSLKSIARPNIEFRGRVGDGELRELYGRCRAFLMPGEEDFGITAVEALASGKAVIALRRGGVLESAPDEDRLGGVFYDQPEEQQLEQAIARFERVEARIAPGDLQASVTRFSEAEFLSKMSRVLSQPQPTSRPCLSAPPVSYASES
jgi:glycosyltransferase involved in cell wall biosynthesis